MSSVVPESSRTLRVLASLGLVLSVGVLVLSYAAIAIYTGRPWLWPVIVHESGDRTLLQTILYFEHAARELPLDLLLGVAIAGSALFVFPRAGEHEDRRAKSPAGLALGLLGVSSVIVLGTLWTGGWAMLVENLLQFPTRPGEPLVWGGHWRYHLLSHTSLMAVSFGLAGVAMLVTKGTTGGSLKGLKVLGFALGSFLALTILFVPSRDSFVDAVFVGHQTREAFTHLFVTIPMAWGVCLLLARPDWNRPVDGPVPVAAAWLTGIGGVFVGLFLLVASLAKSAVSQGQSESVAVLVFPHFFEHVFSYLVATLTAALVFVWGRQKPV